MLRLRRRPQQQFQAYGRVVLREFAAGSAGNFDIPATRILRRLTGNRRCLAVQVFRDPQ